MKSAWDHAERAHELTRNAGLLHASSHLSRSAVFLRARRPGAAFGELRIAAMATPIAWTRRAAGIEPEFPGGNGLRTSWSMRDGSRIVAPVGPPPDLG